MNICYNINLQFTKTDDGYNEMAIECARASSIDGKKTECKKNAVKLSKDDTLFEAKVST